MLINSRAFIWRRIHSLAGLWLVLFLLEHLLVNSQAALLLGDSGKGFVEAVNSIHNLPYLQVIEIFLLGVPMAIHAVWGVGYLFTAKSNACRSDGTTPSLPEYGRNRAYTWQRLSSWVLLIGIILHVGKFRFLEYPESLNQGEKQFYFVTVSIDKGLYTVADRLGAQLYDAAQIQEQREELESRSAEQTLVEAAKVEREQYDAQQQMVLKLAQNYRFKQQWVSMLEKQKIGRNQVVAVSPTFGTASLLSVRDTFKSPIYVALYTIFVLAACFHAFNGLWTFLITWGVVLKFSAQKGALKVTWSLMAALAFLGLAAVWGTYWLNLKY